MAAKQFRERLLQVMDSKDHWGWKLLTSGKLTREQLLIHFQQEYEVYVRDFPLLLARVLGRMPQTAAWVLKRELAENIYEEQTGGLSAKISRRLSHPELFLKMMRGLGFRDKQFEKIELLPTSLAYRSFLDLVTLNYDWRIAAAQLTLFVEGSREDRARLRKDYRPTETLSKKLKNHSLHKFYGLKEKDMDLVKAHHAVEGSHRKSAWETVLAEVPTYLENDVSKTLSQSLDLWLLFRDGILMEMGVDYLDYKRLANLKSA